MLLQMGYTPLHHAAQQGHVLVITILLKYGANPDAVSTVRYSYVMGDVHRSSCQPDPPIMGANPGERGNMSLTFFGCERCCFLYKTTAIYFIFHAVFGQPMPF